MNMVAREVISFAAVAVLMGSLSLMACGFVA